MSPPAKLVLLAEDDVSTREFLAMYLRRMGLFVVETSDGVAACAQLRQYDFDLVVTDFVMPGVDGIGVVNFVKNNAKKTLPVIVLTAHKDRVPEIHAAGASLVLDKPIRYEALRQAVMKFVTFPNGSPP